MGMDGGAEENGHSASQDVRVYPDAMQFDTNFAHCYRSVKTKLK